MEVPDEVVADGYLLPEVAVEGAVETNSLSDVPEHFAENRLALLAVRGREAVETEAELLGGAQRCADFGGYGVEPPPRAHLFQIGHIIVFPG